MLMRITSYDAKESTWESTDRIPVNKKNYVEDFECAAAREGFDVEDPTQCIVLEEGAKAGQRRPGWRRPVRAR